MADFEVAYPILMKHEGGFADDPTDPGGATNHGVTKKNWEAWTKRAATIEEIKALTIEEVKPFYRAWYWDILKLDNEPSQPLANALFDFFANVSPKTFRKVITAAAPLSLDSLFREKMRHYFEECRRRRAQLKPDGAKAMTPEEADKFLLNWGERALEMDI